MSLTFSLPEWQPDWHAEDPDYPGRMTRPVYLNGVLHHLEAIEVTDSEAYGWQVARNPYWNDVLDEWAIASSPDGPFQAVEIDGRQWVIFMSPGC